MFRTLRKWYQRVTRGWANEDCWTLFLHLCEILPGMIRQLKGGHGYPDGITYEEWQTILEDMALGFEAGTRLERHIWFDRGGKEDKEKFDKGMTLFQFWFFALWD